MPSCLGSEIRTVRKRYSLLTQPRRDVVHGQDHWPTAVVTHSLIEGIHSIGAQGEPYIPWI